MKTREFNVSIDGKDTTFLVRSPSLSDQREAQKVYNQAFTDAIKSKSVVRAKLDDLLREQGLWSDEKQAEFAALQKQIIDGEKRLAKGGFALNEAKKLALEMQELRNKIKDLISVRTSLDNHSAEGQADNARFNYLVSACVVYKDNDNKYFKSLEDYLNKADDPVALLGAQNLANMIYGLDNNFEKNLPENKFLHKYKFVDDKLRLIDKRGRLVDQDGRLVDEEGRFIDEEGNFVDKEGNRVDPKGEYLFEAEPFLDDEGKPILPEAEVQASITEEQNSALPKSTTEIESPETSSVKEE
jgi:hypothetical protein